MTVITSISKAAKRISRYQANVRDIKLSEEGVDPETGSENFKLEFSVDRGRPSSRRRANYSIDFKAIGSNVVVDLAGEYGEDELETENRIANGFDTLRDLKKAQRFINSGASQETSGINVPIGASDFTQVPRLELVNKAISQACAKLLTL